MKHVDIRSYGMHPMVLQMNGLFDLGKIIPGAYLMIRSAIEDSHALYFSDVIVIDPDFIEEVTDEDNYLSYSCAASAYDSIGRMSVEDGILWAGGDGHSPPQDMIVCAMIPLYGWEGAKSHFEVMLFNPEFPDPIKTMEEMAKRQLQERK